MPVFKNESNGTWYVMARYVNWKGERKQKCKRGFETKKEAQEWERTFQMQNTADLDMSFEAFVELYTKDMKSRLKENTWLTKEHIIRTKILPYFGKMKISEITTKEIIAWQNELLAYRDEKRNPYSQTYLKTVHNQLSAILNHAVLNSLKYYTYQSKNQTRLFCGFHGQYKFLPGCFSRNSFYVHSPAFHIILSSSRKFSFELPDKILRSLFFVPPVHPGVIAPEFHTAHHSSPG